MSILYRHVLLPRAGQKIVIRLLSDQPNHGAARSFGQHQPGFLAADIRYDVSSHLINLTLFEDRHHDALPLYLQFKYEPSHPYAPIHKDFYWQLWFSDDKAHQYLNIYDIFTGPEATISVNDVEAFCVVVDNQQESLRLSALMRSRRGQGDNGPRYRHRVASNNEGHLSFCH